MKTRKIHEKKGKYYHRRQISSCTLLAQSQFEERHKRTKRNINEGADDPHMTELSVEI